LDRDGREERQQVREDHRRQHRERQERKQGLVAQEHQVVRADQERRDNPHPSRGRFSSAIW
jgi:hypothetical protein